MKVTIPNWIARCLFPQIIERAEVHGKAKQGREYLQGGVSVTVTAEFEDELPDPKAQRS